MPYKMYPLSIRFRGSRIDQRGVPICELSIALAALQRMVCRAYLVIKGKNLRLASLTDTERFCNSLYITNIDSPPKTFNIDWFSEEAHSKSIPMVDDLLHLLHDAINLCIHKGVKESPECLARQLALAIFNDVSELVNRINTKSNIQQIDIQILNLKVFSIDSKVKNSVASDVSSDVASIREKNKGKHKWIKGYVELPQTLNRNHLILKTKTHRVKIFMDDKRTPAFEDVFAKILTVLGRYPSSIIQPDFYFYGEPRFRFDDPVDGFSEFALVPIISKDLFKLENFKKTKDLNKLENLEYWIIYKERLEGDVMPVKTAEDVNELISQ